MALVTPTPFKMPKTLAACADAYYTTMQERLALQKKVDALKAQETAIAEHLIQNLPKSDATGVSGKAARVFITMKTRAQVTNWDKFYGYILKSANKDPGAWSLLQKRVGEEAVNEIWAAGKKIPGVEPFQYPKVGYSALK